MRRRRGCATRKHVLGASSAIDIFIPFAASTRSPKLSRRMLQETRCGSALPFGWASPGFVSGRITGAPTQKTLAKMIERSAVGRGASPVLVSAKIKKRVMRFATHHLAIPTFRVRHHHPRTHLCIFSASSQAGSEIVVLCKKATRLPRSFCAYPRAVKYRLSAVVISNPDSLRAVYW